MRTTDLRALTVRQPFAWQIMTGEKEIEYRSWKTDYRGLLLIHASSKVRLTPTEAAEWPKADAYGVILGSVVLDRIEGGEGDYEWFLRNPRPLAEPVRCAGGQRLWKPPEDVLALLPDLDDLLKGAPPAKGQPPRTKPSRPDFAARRAKLQARASKKAAEVEAMTDEERRAHKAEYDRKAAIKQVVSWITGSGHAITANVLEDDGKWLKVRITGVTPKGVFKKGEEVTIRKDETDTFKQWTLAAIRNFVASLGGHLQIFTPAELYLLFQQNGLLTSSGKGKSFVKALATGRFPKEEIEKFVSGEPSLVDEFVQDPTQTLEALEAGAKKADEEGTIADDAGQVVDEQKEEEEQKFPVVETRDVLCSLDLHAVSSADEEAAEFLVASAVAKMWKHAYRDEESAVAQATAFSGDYYSELVKSRFLDEYHEAKSLAIPPGYGFRIDAKSIPPNLMQRQVAVRVREAKRAGNWSGTGAGKTLASVLATRVVGSKLTVICCPNSVVEGWREAILAIFPDSMVAAKTFDPDWSGAATGPKHRYLILNYEAFQQPDSAERVRGLVEREPIDFIIVDEIHYAKQRAVENVSERRKMVEAMTSQAAERNPDLHVLGMSATPVINNLQEGKSMVELVTGLAHDDLDTRPTVPNCMKLHQRLLTLGIRWMPDYTKMLGYECREERVEVDCGELVEEIRALGMKSTPLALEQILTRVRLPAIRQHVRPKTLIYTYYIDGIDRLLRDALIEDGWKVGFYTGDDKTGKDAFIKGDLDVLIATAAIGTGVDGLQLVCNRLIINVLPWTRAEYDQLLGRIYRQNQFSKEEVAVIIPLTFAEVNGQRWSWCESKMQRLAFKKSIADAAVDGVVPEGHLRSPAQALQDVMAWLERLESGHVEVITRTKIVVPLPDTDPADVKRRQRRYGDFSAMNRTWNQTRSENTHARLQANPEEWAQYHTLYREARKDWAVVPYEELIRWCQQRSGYIIGDFGCGEAKLAEALSNRHTVHSFDHVAINENVVACDMAHVPLDNETLDVAIFSLSLMGANFADHIAEAYRTLKLDGHLHIFEPTSRFTDRERFIKAIKELGFGGIDVANKWKFTHIHARKTENRPKSPVEIRF